MHHTYFNIGDITIDFQTSAELKTKDFELALRPFIIDKPGLEKVEVVRYFNIPDLSNYDLGEKIYSKHPYIVYQNNESKHIYYLNYKDGDENSNPQYFADFLCNYSLAKIYSPPEVENYNQRFGWRNLTGFATDSLWLAQFLINYNALMIHSSAAIFNNQGLLFIGRSEAGKTTTIRMLQKAKLIGQPVEILCDETNIIRRHEKGWRVYGTWGHGEEPEVSGFSAPLKGVFILRKSNFNKISLLSSHSEKLNIILQTVFRPLMTETWWNKSLNFVDQLISEIPFYDMYFDKSGEIIPVLDLFTNK